MPTDERPRIKYTQKVALDMSELYMNSESILHCSHCHDRLGVLHTLRFALFKKPGTIYLVPCKSCKTMNPRVKGAYKQQVEQQWKALEQQVREQHERGEHP